MDNLDSLLIGALSALTVAVVGGFRVSAVGGFGHQRNTNIRSRSLTQLECLALAVLLIVFLLAMAHSYEVFVAVFDWSSAKVLLSILLVGLGVTVSKGINFQITCPIFSYASL